MNDKEIEACGADTSSSVTFNLGIIVENGRLSTEQRRRIASIINRSCSTITLSLNHVVEGRFEVALSKRSSAMGTIELDAGMTDDG